MQRERYATLNTPPDDTPCNSHRSSYLRDYTFSEDRPHSAGVRPRLLNKLANATHAIQKDDSDDENETWVLEGWKDEASTVLENACQSAKLPSKYTRNTPCALPTNVRRVASAATSRPKPPVHKQPAHGQRQRAAGAPDGAGTSKQAGVRPKGAAVNRSPKPPLGRNLEVGDESDVEPSPVTVRVRAASCRSLQGPPAYTPGSTNAGTHSASASTHSTRTSTHPESPSTRPTSASPRTARASMCPASVATEAPAARAESGRGMKAVVNRSTPGVASPVVDALSNGDTPSLAAPPAPLGEHAPHAEPSCVRDPLLEHSSLAAASRLEPEAHSHALDTEHREGGVLAAHPRTFEWVTPTKRQLPSLPALHALGHGEDQAHLQQHQLPHLQVQLNGSQVQQHDQQSPLLLQHKHQHPQHPQLHLSQGPTPHQQHDHHGLQPIRQYARSAAAAMASQRPQWQSNRLKSADAVLPTSHGPQAASLVARLSLSPTRPLRSTSGEHASSQDSLPSPGRARICLQPLSTQLSAQHPTPPQQQHHHLHHSPDHHHHHHHHHHYHRHHLSHPQLHLHQLQPLQQEPLQHQQHLQQRDHPAVGGAVASADASPRGADALLLGAGLHRRHLPPPKPPPLPPSPASIKAAEVLLQHMRSKYNSEGAASAAASAAQARELQSKFLGPGCSPPPGLVGKGIGGLGAPVPQYARGSDPSGMTPPRSALGRSPSLPTPNKGPESSGLAGQGLKELMLTGQSVGGGGGVGEGSHALEEQRGHGRRL